MNITRCQVVEYGTPPPRGVVKGKTAVFSIIIVCKFNENVSYSARYVNNVLRCTHAWLDACTVEEYKSTMPPATLRWAEALKHSIASHEIKTQWNASWTETTVQCHNCLNV